MEIGIFNEALDIVALVNDVPEKALRRGQVGTVVVLITLQAQLSV